MDCKHIAGCIFFNDRMADMPSMAQIYKDRYCRGGGAGCARFVVCEAMGKEAVPADLYPNDMRRADEILAG